MPIAHNLRKVAKNISKSLAANHVKGRKFKQLNRATQRDNKITNLKAKALTQKENDMAVYFFLQQLIEDDVDFVKQSEFTTPELRQMVDLFFHRFDDELDQFRNERRKGRPMAPKHQILEEKVKHDIHLWKTGVKVPDLTDKDTVTALRLWNGTTGGTTVMKFCELKESEENDGDEQMN